jgi:ferric-dicitrate binding protein FerR (iron transport regulator)
MLKTLDKKKLHIDDANDKCYPQPDVPVQEAWEQMQQLLQQAPAASDSSSHSGYGIGKGASKWMLGAGAGALVIISLIIYVVTAKKGSPTPTQVTYYSERYPKIDTLADGTIAFLDTLSSIAVTNLPAKEKKITINNGGCYFRQLNKNASEPWQLKIGSINILPNNANIYVSVDTAAAVAVVQLQTGSAAIQVGEEKLQIAAGESVRFNTQKEMLHNRQKMDPNTFSYANRVFDFSNTSFKEAAGYIEKAYGVKIIFKGDFNHCTITTRFDNKSLKEILDILAYTLAFDYKIDEKNKQVLISGDGCN